MDMKQIQTIVKDNGVIFLAYGEFITQSLILGMTEAMEKEAKSNNITLGKANNIYTICIELSQNIMKYSNSFPDEDKAEGLIVVSREDNRYTIHSQNIILKQNKEKIEERLLEINQSSKEQIKNRYRELRRSGKNTHEKGGGIGFYEVAKRSDELCHEFIPIDDEKFYFHFISSVYK